MSTETAPEYLSHKDNRNIQVRLDYILLYRSEIKAKIIRILESWTSTKYAEWYKSLADSKEQKSEPPAEDLWITMSYDQFALFSYGTMQHDTIKQQVDDLVAMKHIERRPNPAYPYGPPQYRINRQELQNALNNLEIPPNLFDLGGLLVSPRKKRTTPEKYPQGGGKKPGGDPGKIPPGSGEKSPPSNNISKNTKNHSKNESAYKGNVSSDEQEATASTRTPSSVQEKIIDSDSHQPSRDYVQGEINDRTQSDSDHTHSVSGNLGTFTGASSTPGNQTPEQQSPDARAEEKGSRVRNDAGNHAAVTTPVASSKPKIVMPSLFASTPERPVLTPEGSNVREWYALIRLTKVRLTKENILACNGLAECDGISFENLKAAIEHWDEDDYVKSKGIVVDLQMLEKSGGAFSFEKAMIAIRKRQQAEARAKERSAQSTTSNSTLENLKRLQAKFVGTATAAVQGGL